jgi:hypothetical protein
MSRQRPGSDVRLTAPGGHMEPPLTLEEQTIAREVAGVVEAMRAVARAAEGPGVEETNRALDEHERALVALERRLATVAAEAAPTALVGLLERALADAEQARREAHAHLAQRLTAVGAQLAEVHRAGQGAARYGEATAGARLLTLQG